MKKNAKRFLSMLLALSMVFGLLVFPAGATEAHDHAEEANTASADEKFDIVVDGNVTIVPLKTEGVDLDEEDPVIIAVEKELKNMMVLNAEGDPVPLTEEQIMQVLYMFQQYLDQWEANAHLLGVQVPFFLQYNDNGEDGLGILGEMLAMAGATVDAVRAGYMSFDDLTGMIMNFHYGDQLGLQYYGNAIASARNEIMNLVESSGAVTEEQKLLVINDWLAHNVTFDMPYIMNNGKEEGEKPMVAENPQKHERYDDVYNVMFELYKSQINDTFESNIINGLKAEMQKQFYIAAIEQGCYQGVYAEVEAQVTESVRQQAYEAVYQDAYDQAYADFIAGNVPTEPTEPEATEPEATEPEATEPEATEPEATEPEATEPEATEPEVTEPEATEPEATEPEATEPEATEPEATEPEATEPEVTEPVEGNEEAPVVNEEGEEPETEIDPEADAYAKAYAEEYANAAADAAVEENKAMIEEQATAVANDETDKFMAENEAAINADPVAFVEAAFGADAAAQIAQQWEGFWADCEANGIPGMVSMFSGEIWKAVIEQFYIQGMTQQGMTEEQAAAQAAQIMEADADAIAADPYGYCVTNFGQEGADQAQAVVNDELKKMGIDGSTETNPEGRVSLEVIVALQMDTPQQDPMLQKPDGSYMTPNEAIPIFADQAAVGLTGGVLDYWQGSHFGALGRGSAVCLGYTKAFTYLVQYMHPEVYGKNGANTDMSKAENWKVKEDLYYTDGVLDPARNYLVDDVRITFDASVTMYGETEDNFNSDHFWNAVRIDGKWYYVDPCYTDVYTEVMMRDRVETDGSMNHMYFLFSHTTAAQLYDGNYKEIKTLYENDAIYTDYEDSWISRIKSNTYFDGGYAYYLYDSTDLISLMEEANSDQGMSSDMMEQNYIYKIVRHKLTETDAGTEGDIDYEALIEFNFKADEDDEESIARVYDPAADKLIENVMLTELYAQHQEECKVYPSLALTAALYNGKIYFNVSNKILSYDIASGALAIVKEYNTVRAQRDKTNPFGGMAFTVTTGNNYDLAVENHPIAGLTIKDDGKMYVSIATNFAFISGKDPHNSEDQSSYGYEFEESNYNIAYNSYSQGQYDESMMESYGYSKEINDNDEFMWSANFVETLTMSHLTGSRHSYQEVSVPAYCGRNAFTENRCTTCGMAEADSRVEVEGSALDHHHYVEFIETFYTKADNGNWNTGRVYVCTVCGFHIEEPEEPTKNDQMSEEDYQKQLENYEKEKAIYDDAVATAGHTYVDPDAVWAEDLSSVTFQNLSCNSVCIDRKAYLDCLLEDDNLSVTLDEAKTLPVGIVGTMGTCEEGVTQIYGATEQFEVEFIKDKPVAVTYGGTQLVKLEPGTHSFENCVCTMCGEFSVKRIAGEGRVETAIAAADVLKEVLGVETFDSIIIANGDNFADALAGSYLATAKSAPILLHRNTGAGDELNENYIDANLSEGGTIYLLGGTVAIPESIEDALIASNYNVVRLKGDTRLDTNIAILEEAGVSEDDEILIVTGWNYADALSASATGKPILLVNENKAELTETQIEFLKKHAANQYAIIGGSGAISQTLEDAIAAIVETDIIRVYGETREATSVRVAKRYFEDPSFVLVAYSRNYPDGLAAGPLAYALGAPLLLTNAGQEAVGADYISTNEIGAGYIIGGAAAITDETVKTCFGITAEGEIPAL